MANNLIFWNKKVFINKFYSYFFIFKTYFPPYLVQVWVSYYVFWNLQKIYKQQVGRLSVGRETGTSVVFFASLIKDASGCSSQIWSGFCFSLYDDWEGSLVHRINFTSRNSKFALCSAKCISHVILNISTGGKRWSALFKSGLENERLVISSVLPYHNLRH